MKHSSIATTEILVPGGVWQARHRGHAKGDQYAREKRVPYSAFVLACRRPASSCAQRLRAGRGYSSEFDPATPHRVIYNCAIAGRRRTGRDDASGAWPCKIEPDTLAFRIYGQTETVSGTGIATSSIASTKRRWCRGLEDLRLDSGRQLRRDDRDPGHPPFYWFQFHPSSVETAGAASAVQVVYRSGLTSTARSARHRKKRLRSSCSCGRKKSDGDRGTAEDAQECRSFATFGTKPGKSLGDLGDSAVKDFDFLIPNR